jgi:hypothetical protein
LARAKAVAELQRASRAIAEQLYRQAPVGAAAGPASNPEVVDTELVDTK